MDSRTAFERLRDERRVFVDCPCDNHECRQKREEYAVLGATIARIDALEDTVHALQECADVMLARALKQAGAC